MVIPEYASSVERIAAKRKWLQVVIVIRHRPEAFYNFNKLIKEIHEETWTMAKNVKAANKKELKKAEFAGFANVELNADEKAEMRQWILETEQVQVELDEMLASLYKVSVQKSEALGSYQATAFCMDAKSPNAGLILSAYAPHWWDAMACLAYKHAVKCEGIWGVDADSEPDAWG